jgi:hypothetical protein
MAGEAVVMLMGEPKGYQWDESAWPIVRVAAPRVAASDAEYDSLLSRYTDALERGPLVMLFEFGLGAALSPERRDQLRRHARTHDRLLASMQLGLGIIARSAFHRASARALIWLVSPPYPVQLFADWGPAELWAAERLRSRERTAS